MRKALYPKKINKLERDRSLDSHNDKYLFTDLKGREEENVKGKVKMAVENNSNGYEASLKIYTRMMISLLLVYLFGDIFRSAVDGPELSGGHYTLSLNHSPVCLTTFMISLRQVCAELVQFTSQVFHMLFLSGMCQTRKVTY